MPPTKFLVAPDAILTATAVRAATCTNLSLEQVKNLNYRKADFLIPLHY